MVKSALKLLIHKDIFNTYYKRDCHTLKKAIIIILFVEINSL